MWPQLEALTKERDGLRASLTAAQSRIAELEAGLRHTLGAMKPTIGWCSYCGEAAALLAGGKEPKDA